MTTQSERVSIFCARCHVYFSAAVSAKTINAGEQQVRHAVREMAANKWWAWRQGRFDLMEDVCRGCLETER